MLKQVERRLVIFDVEGTLVDSVALTLRCWQETLRSFGYQFSTAELHHHSGRDPDEMLRALLPATVAERIAETAKKQQGERYRDHYLPKVTGFPQVRALFARAKQSGHAIALATTCSSDELRHYQKLTEVSDLVDAVACGEDVDRDKPHPDLIDLACARSGGIKPEHAVMVGDTPYDAQAAGRAGAASIGVLSGGFSRQELEQGGCLAVYRDAADLLERFSASALTRWAND